MENIPSFSFDFDDILDSITGDNCQYNSESGYLYMFQGMKILPVYLADAFVDPNDRRNLMIPTPPYECEQEDHFKDF